MGVRVNRLLIIFGAIALWEILASTPLVPQFFIKTPSTIILKTNSIILSGELLPNLQITVISIGLAVSIAMAIGLALGLVIGAYKFLGDIFEPLLFMIFAFPLVVVFPLFVIWFGFGMNANVAFGVITGFLPITINTMAGVRSVDQALIKASRSMGASASTIYRKIILPASTPTIITGLRQGVALTIIGVIVGEMLAPIAGLGHIMDISSTTLDYAKLSSVVLITLFIGTIINEGLRFLEGRTSSWRIRPR